MSSHAGCRYLSDLLRTTPARQVRRMMMAGQRRSGSCRHESWVFPWAAGGPPGRRQDQGRLAVTVSLLRPAKTAPTPILSLSRPGWRFGASSHTASPPVISCSAAKTKRNYLLLMLKTKLCAVLLYINTATTACSTTPCFHDIYISLLI